MEDQTPGRGKPPIPQSRFVIVLIVIGFMIVSLGAGVGIWKIASAQPDGASGTGDSQVPAVSTAAP